MALPLRLLLCVLTSITCWSSEFQSILFFDEKTTLNFKYISCQLHSLPPLVLQDQENESLRTTFSILFLCLQAFCWILTQNF